MRRTKSADAAALVAKHCKKNGDYKTAIEFLLLAKKTTEAFELAQQHDEMKTYAETLSSNGSSPMPIDHLHLTTSLLQDICCYSQTARIRQ